MSGNGFSASKLKAVILDYGEVICHRPTTGQMAELAKFFAVDVNVFGPLWERNRGRYDRGDLTPEAYWTMLANDASTKLRPGDLEEICRLDVDMRSNVNPNMVGWIDRLGRSGKKVGLLSNMPTEMVTHCRQKFDWINHFDFVTFSAEVNLVKPEPAIYEHTLRGLGVSAPEALFLDDKEVNVAAARQLGINAIRVASMPQLREDLATAGFTDLPAES